MVPAGKRRGLDAPPAIIQMNGTCGQHQHEETQAQPEPSTRPAQFHITKRERKMTYPTIIAGTAIAIASTSVNAAINPFAEDFLAGASGWVEADAITAPTFVPGGGPDSPADSFISTTHNFVNDSGSSTPILFQGSDVLATSGGAFDGDYIAAGVNQISFNIRHFASAPLSMYYRVAPQFGPGFVAVDFAPVLPGQWTTITLDLSPTSPNLIPEGTVYADIFSNVQLFQIGVAFPSIAGTDAPFEFQLDDVTLAPTPATALLLAGLPLVCRRRR